VEYFEIICNAIVLISAVLIAVKNIAEMCGKPIKFIKKKNDTEFEAKVIAIINKVMPDLFLTHDLQTKTTYLADRQRYLEEIKNAVIQQIGTQLSNVDALAAQYKALEISAKDVLREKIVCLYESNKDRRKLRHFERRALDQYYKDYKEMKGNSYIDIIYNRMKTWEVEPDDYE
jgi:hypothetical protein